MAADYTEEINDAFNDILEAGLMSELREYKVENYDPVEGEDVETLTTTPAAIMSMPSASGFSTDITFMSGMARGENKVFLLAAKGLTFEPKPGMFVAFDGKLWEIGAAEGKGGILPLNLSGEPIMFTLGCFKSSRDV